MHSFYQIQLWKYCGSLDPSYFQSCIWQKEGIKWRFFECIQILKINLKPLVGGGIINEIYFDSSVGKEFFCNAGDPSSIPGSGRSAGEGTCYPLQYSWTSLMAQLEKNPSAMWETWVWSLSWEDPLEKGKRATHSSILVWRIPWNVKSIGMQRIGHNWETFTFTFKAVCWFY